MKLVPIVFSPAMLVTVALSCALLLWAGCGGTVSSGPKTNPNPSPTPSPTPGSPSTAVSGRVVDSATNAPIAGTVAVALESGPGDFLVVMRTTADAQGNFTFNSVGTGAYAVVAEAQASSGALYVPAIVVSGNGPFGAGSTIGPGTNVGTIPLTAPSAAELLSGTVASANAGGAPVPVKVNFDPTTFVADFVFVVPNPVATPVVTSTACSGGVGACADFNVTIPAQTAFFGVFNSSGTTLQPFSSGPVYGLRAYAFSTTTGQANCSPPVQTLPTFNASPGAVLTVNPFQFTGCQ